MSLKDSPTVKRIMRYELAVLRGRTQINDLQVEISIKSNALVIRSHDYVNMNSKNDTILIS